MIIPTHVLQSILAVNASAIRKEEMMFSHHKDSRSYQSKQGNRGYAEKANKLVEKSRKKLRMLVRNQSALKEAIKFNAFNVDLDNLTTYPEIFYD